MWTRDELERKLGEGMMQWWLISGQEE